MQPEGLHQDDLQVFCSVEHDRLPLPPPLEAGIETVWRERVSANPRLFNGTKFRLGAVTRADGRIALHLGLTDYKSHLGTNMAHNWLKIRDREPEGCYLASPLGNGAVASHATSF